MDYDLSPGQRQQLVDQGGNPIPEASGYSVTVANPSIARLIGVDGILVLAYVSAGSTSVDVAPPGGPAVTHTITCSEPFDWSLGPSV